jgi:hypothetical protein
LCQRFLFIYWLISWENSGMCIFKKGLSREFQCLGYLSDYTDWHLRWLVVKTVFHGLLSGILLSYFVYEDNDRYICDIFNCKFSFLVLQLEDAFWLLEICTTIRFSQRGLAGIKKTAVLDGRVWFWLWAEVFLIMTAFILVVGLGLCSQCSGWLQVGWSGDQILVGWDFLHPSRPALGVHPTTCIMGTGSLQEG